MGAGGKGRGYLSPGKALMKSLWSLLWLSSTRVLFKSHQHLSEDTPSFPLTSHLQPLPLDFLPFVSLSPTTASFHCCYPLLPVHQPPFTSCPPLWSGHGSCLYLTNRGGPIPLAPRHLKLMMWWDVWKAVCTCVVSKGHVCISAFFKRHSETLMHPCSIQEQIVILFPSSPGTDTTLLSQQSGSVGNFTAVLPLIQPSYAPLLLLSSGHPLLLLSRAAALYLPNPKLNDLVFSTVVGWAAIIQYDILPRAIY